MPVKIEIAPATADDVRPFFEGGVPHRLRAWVGKVDGRVVGTGGLYYLEDHTRVGFLVLDKEGYKYPKHLLRATHAFLQMLRSEGVSSVIAVADPGIEASERFLLHFGFKPAGQINGQTIYNWSQGVPRK